MRKKTKLLDCIATIFVLVGALNWGLIGLFNFNLVQAIFGVSLFTTIIYVLVGVSAIWSGVKLLMKKRR